VIGVPSVVPVGGELVWAICSWRRTSTLSMILHLGHPRSSSPPDFRHCEPASHQPFEAQFWQSGCIHAGAFPVSCFLPRLVGISSFPAWPASLYWSIARVRRDASRSRPADIRIRLLDGRCKRCLGLGDKGELRILGVSSVEGPAQERDPIMNGAVGPGVPVRTMLLAHFESAP
jgi:hypothetical protein